MAYKIEEELQVRKKCDVLVAGGGVAGVAAAVSAARLGKKVVLVEKSIKLGGLSTLGLVNYFVPMCDGEGHLIAKGMALEFVEISKKYSYDKTLSSEFVNGNIPEEKLAEYKKEGKMPPRFQFVFSAEIFALCLTELCVKEGVDLMFDTIVTNVIKDKNDQGNIEGVIIENKDGRGVILAKQVIDVTGDSDLLDRLGVPTVERGNYHSFIGYEINFDSIKEALEKNNIGFVYRDRCGGKASLSGSNQDPDIPLYYGTKNSEINRYIINNHKDLLESVKPEDKWSRDIATIPDMCQFRTTRRIDSEYVVKAEDYNRHFEDTVGVVGDFAKRSKLWEIPFSSMYKKGYTNILTAGRSIGADKWAWDALRVIPPAILSGQAAGVAASMAIDNNCPVYDIDVKKLQAELENEGVDLRMNDRFIATNGVNTGECFDRL